MATNYPNGYDSLTNPTGTDALSSPAHASQHADANDAIEAIQATLGLNPEGAYANVDARLDALVTDAAAAASSYADSSSASAGSALASAGSAAAAAGTAYSYQQGAETNANQAAVSAGSAYTSMLAAAASESAAAASETAAALSASAASGSASAAATSEANAASAAASAVSTHNADTTSVHGITDTADLVYTSDSRLSDARTPTAHAASHESGGGDTIVLAQSQIWDLTTDLAAKAPLESPTFTGTPAAPTAAAGTDTTQVATTAFVQAAVGQQPEIMAVALSDEDTALTAGTAVVTFRAPFAMTLTDIPRASLTTASSSGAVTVDVNESGTSVLGANKLSIDASEKTSVTAATPTTLADTSIADDAEITFDIDAAGTDAAGLKVTLFFRRA